MLLSIICVAFAMPMHSAGTVQMNKKQSLALPKGIVLNAGQYPSFVLGKIEQSQEILWLLEYGIKLDIHQGDTHYVFSLEWTDPAGKSISQSLVNSHIAWSYTSFKNSLHGKHIEVANTLSQQFDNYPAVCFQEKNHSGNYGWQFRNSLSQFNMPSLTIAGVQEINIVQDGRSLELISGNVRRVIPLPTLLNEITGEEHIVIAEKVHNNKVNLTLAQKVKAEQSLAIPILFSTMFGGSGEESVKGIAIDGMGNSYVVGTTQSTDFPSSVGAYVSASKGVQDVFIAKYDSAGVKPLYMAVIGGNSLDQGNAIAIDSSGCVYVTGSTTSIDFPVTTNAFQTNNTIADEDVFIVKLNNTGTALLYSTFLIGIADDVGNGIAVDKNGDIVICGYTGALFNSPHTFPKTKNAFDTSFNGGANDAFIAKIKPAGNGANDLLFSTLLGGDGNDNPMSVTVDELGRVYVVGETFSPAGFPSTASSLQNSCSGPSDGFISVLSSNADSLLYSSFVGGSDYDRITDIAFDESSQTVFLAGSTSSDGTRTLPGLQARAFPVTSGAFDTIYNGGSYDGFVMRLQLFTPNPFKYSTLLGGNAEDRITGIGIDVCAAPYIVGYTGSSDFPITDDAPDSVMQKQEGFIAKLNATGNVLVFSSFFGNDKDDESNCVAVGKTGSIYIGGTISGTGLPGSSQVSNNKDAYIARMQIGILPLRPAIISNGPLTFCKGNSVVLDAFSRNLVAYQWSKDNRIIQGANTAAITVRETGIYTVDVIDASGCIGRESVEITVNELPLVSFPTNPVICKGNTATIDIVSKDSLISYEWTPASTLSCTTCLTPIASPLSTTTYTLTVENKDGCISKDSITVYVIDSVSLAIGTVQDTVATCPNVPVYTYVPIRNTMAVPLTVKLMPIANPLFSSLQDSLLLQSDSTALFPIQFTGTGQEGLYSYTVRFVDQCGAEQQSTLWVSVEKPVFTIKGNTDTTICQYQPIAKTITISNESRLAGMLTITAKGKGFASNVSKISIEPKKTSEFIVSFAGDSAGTYIAEYILEHSCGDKDTVALLVTVIAKPVSFTYKVVDTIARKTGEKRIQNVYADSLQILNQLSSSMIQFALTHEQSTLILDSVTTRSCAISLKRSNDTVFVQMENCAVITNPIATLHYRTLVGETLAPWVKLHSISTVDKCFNLTLNNTSDTIKLLPYGCEISTLTIGNALSNLAFLHVDDAKQTVKVRYSVSETVPAQFRLVNMLGQTIHSIVLPVHQPGEYEITIPLQGIVQGHYVLLFSAGRYVESETLFFNQ